MYVCMYLCMHVCMYACMYGKGGYLHVVDKSNHRVSVLGLGGEYICSYRGPGRGQGGPFQNPTGIGSSEGRVVLCTLSGVIYTFVGSGFGGFRARTRDALEPASSGGLAGGGACSRVSFQSRSARACSSLTLCSASEQRLICCQCSCLVALASCAVGVSGDAGRRKEGQGLGQMRTHKTCIN